MHSVMTVKTPQCKHQFSAVKVSDYEFNFGFGFEKKSMWELEEVISPAITKVSPLVNAPTYVSKYRSTTN